MGAKCITLRIKVLSNHGLCFIHFDVADSDYMLDTHLLNIHSSPPMEKYFSMDITDKDMLRLNHLNLLHYETGFYCNRCASLFVLTADMFLKST